MKREDLVGNKRGSKPRRVLYISYDGLLEPLGQSQVLPYVDGLVSKGIQFTLLTFEKPGDMSRRSITLDQLLAWFKKPGIRWIALRYHRRPALLAKVYDLFLGTLIAMVIAIKDGVIIVHCRSYVAALMGWILKRLLGVHFLFDMRGFWADERVDGGLWRPGGVLYRVTKRLEQHFLMDADQIVTLTERARSIIERWPGVERSRVSVIPTCVDLSKFSPPVRSLVRNPSPALIYTGSVGTWYLLDEMLRFVGEAIKRFTHTRFFLITRNCEEASKTLAKTDLPPEAVLVTSVAPRDVPCWLARSHAGLAFIKPAWSKQASCPTKIGEYLAMGLPVVVNDAVGDVNEVISTNGVGAILSNFSTEAYNDALDQLERLWADPQLSSRCRQVAETYFSLRLGVDRYWEIYQRMT